MTDKTLKKIANNSARKAFVLDTSVLLHDPESILNFKDNDVILPLVCLEELGSYTKQTTELGYNARRVFRLIDVLKKEEKCDFASGVLTENGGRIFIMLPKERSEITGFPLSLDRSSNKAISIAFFLKNNSNYNNSTYFKVIYVSKDFISRVKAESMHINAEDYENLKLTQDTYRKSIKKIKVEKIVIDEFFKNGKIHLKDNIKKDLKGDTLSSDTLSNDSLLVDSMVNNEYLILESEERSSALCRYNFSKKNLEPIFSTNKGVWGIHPINVEQRCSLDLLLREDIPLVTLIGPAGTGKTLLSIACGLRKVFDEGVYNKILVTRPVIPFGKDIGYLPGTKEEKLESWMQPIYDNLEFILGFANGKENSKEALDFVLNSGKLETEALTYIRGRTLPKTFMVIDEAQNLTPHEVKTIISRAGKGSKVVLTGDPFQIDNPYLDKDSNGLSYVFSKFYNQKLYGHVYLNKTERSELAALAAEIM